MTAGVYRRPGLAEHGYITPMTALLLVPLLIFAAFSVDIGGWLSQATKAQNAADAAALAAAVHLPDKTLANSTARDLAAANGFVDGVGGVDVLVTYPQDDIIRVEIVHEARFFLSRIVMEDTLDIRRFADAFAVPPLIPGVPTNVLGFGPYSIDGSPVSNYWLYEGNDCTEADEGDWRAAQATARPWCDDSQVPQAQWKGATDGRTGGSFYLVQIPPGATDPSTLYVFDPGACNKYGEKPQDPNFSSERFNVSLYLRQWDTGGTLTRRTDDTPLTNTFWRSDDCPRDTLPNQPRNWTDTTQGWTETPITFPGNATGEMEYHLVQTVVDGRKRRALNHFAFWVKPAGGTSCTTVAPGACPTISGDEWMSIASEGNGMGKAEELFLTEVHPRYEGLDLVINIWDPGEGMDNLQFVDPLGKSLDFTWTTDDPAYGTDNSAENCAGRPCLNLDPKNKQYPPKLPEWKKGWRFNGRMVTFTIPLDGQTEFSRYPHYWFRMRITPPSNRWVRDEVTFSVEHGGQQLRLVD